MFPGMDPRAVEQAMKKMGIKQIDVPAFEVIIKSDNKDIVIVNPKVVKINMMGQDSFQITGVVEERQTAVEIPDADIATVCAQAGVSQEKAKEALEASKGDLAEAIMDLKKD